jgi:mannose-6-phosphate isomerase-like protein (cupin superfamily)
MKKRVFVNPVIGDKATLIRSADETKGEYTLFQIEVAPGGGNSLHIHETYTERFEVVQGELSLQLGKESHVLRKGESLLIPKKAFHCFTNRSSEPVKFKVEFRPAQPGFEKAIAIAYGLAADGLVNKKSIPYNFSYLAILVAMSGTLPTGLARMFTPMFRWVANHSRKTEAALVNKYC